MTEAGTQAFGRQTLGEEIANSVSHGIGTLAAAISIPVLVVTAVRHGTVADIVGVSVFGAAMVLLYLASTLYHAFPRNRAKQVFQVLDHSAIYLLIAGTYTPFTLGVLGGAWGWSLFGVVWGLAATGVLLTAIGGVKYAKTAMALYIAMGWLVVIAAKPLAAQLPTAGIGWLVAGGISYTVGVIFYAAKRLTYAHFVWHLFVLAGTVCHFIAVEFYAI